MNGHRTNTRFVQIIHVPKAEDRAEAILSLDEDGNVWFIDREEEAWRPLPWHRDLSEDQ